MSVTDYEQLKTRIENIIRIQGYTIDVEEDDAVKITHDGIVASYIYINETTGLVREGPELVKPGPIDDYDALWAAPKILEAVKIERPVFNIHDVKTKPAYGKKGLALLLIIYGICRLKIQFFNIEYVVTEDNTDTASMFFGNMYTKIGFRYIDAYYYDEQKNLVLPFDGEKQLHLNRQFINNSNKILDDILYKIDPTAGKNNPAVGKDRKPGYKSSRLETGLVPTNNYNLRPRPTVKGGKKSKKQNQNPKNINVNVT